MFSSESARRSEGLDLWCPGDVIDSEPRCRRHRRGALTGEGRYLPVKMRLVGIAALGRHRSRAVASGESVRSSIETDQLSGSLGSEPEL